MRKNLYIMGLALLLAGCSNEGFESRTLKTGERWYSPAEVELGQRLFAEHCASCHGGFAQGASNWRQVDAQGMYPPPPLNGSGHAWHHSLDQLREVIRYGRPETIPSNMPAWGDKLKPAEIDAVIAWFQSHWPDRIYDAWVQRNRG